LLDKKRYKYNLMYPHYIAAGNHTRGTGKVARAVGELTDIRQQVDFLNKSARQMVFESPRNLPRAIALCEIASELAAKSAANQPPYQSGLAESLINLGEFYIQYANYDLALSFLFKALQTLELIDDPHTNATILLIGVTTVTWSIRGSAGVLSQSPADLSPD
jgi:tetratricopeptide (TPR) repeat protein